MAQPRLTDYFTQRKKGITREGKPAPRRSRRGCSPPAISTGSPHKDPPSSSVHEEFVRVVDEAAGLNGGAPVVGSKTSPRTPKRTLDGASSTTDASTAKKRQVEATGDFNVNIPEKVPKKTSRKKLVLPPTSPAGSCEDTQPPAAPCGGVGASGSTPGEGPISWRHGQGSKALSKEDMATLKSCLQKVKKPNATSVISAPTPPADPSTLKAQLAQAKELVAKVQRRKERPEAPSQQQDAEARDSTEAPAYQRYHTLAQASPPGLSLPYQYKVLAEMFRSMETVVAMLYNRCETPTFAKIKQGVQDMTHKRFEESHVAQIKTVFPEAYTFRQEKNIPPFSGGFKKGTYQLTMEPSFASDQKGICPVFSASRLLERRRTFHLNLVSIVKHHHKAFLSSLVPPMSVPEDRLTRWHPRFSVDTVPPVGLGVLPQPPHTEKVSTAQEVLEKARSLITPKMEKALVSLTLTPEDAVEVQETASPQTPADQLPHGLKGVSKSLVDRIRAKEAQKIKAAMTRTSGQAERLLMMSRLPELARILRNVFVEEKKPALLMEVACNRMVASYRSALSSGEMEKHVRLLAEVAADWLAIHPVRKDFYLKVNKKMELSSVVDRLSSRLDQEQRS
ncbi:DNA replication factor Cdt1 [Takifugu flavidus]|uniref:DNA replication factor Cdt1 n=1 Tax=Takifugu flavidus TaxID=433684 RepID=UPI00254431E9|nr:DNA replication factor Cdt1 [Takifugu flavidus]